MSTVLGLDMTCVRCGDPVVVVNGGNPNGLGTELIAVVKCGTRSCGRSWKIDVFVTRFDGKPDLRA